jgi:REP element-mobilizing transposase RayT
MAARLTHDRPVGFGQVERELVEQVIAGHCQVRGWMLHAVHCRAEHVHVVVSARDREPGVVIGEFKAWCTRALRAAGRIADVGATWGHGGSCRRLYDAFAVERVVMYVRECQDGPRHARGGGRRNALPW